MAKCLPHVLGHLRVLDGKDDLLPVRLLAVGGGGEHDVACNQKLLELFLMLLYSRK